MLVSALYLIVCRLLELIVLVGRSDRATELEILVLRHELAILGRQVTRPRSGPTTASCWPRQPDPAPPLLERILCAAGNIKAGCRRHRGHS